MDTDVITRKHLVNLLKGGVTHVTLDDALAGLNLNLRGIKINGLPYSIWQLVEHIRITQWDILEYSKDQTHQSPKWPDGYWPKEPAPANEEAWDKALKQIESDVAEFIGLVNDPESNLYTPLPKGNGQTLLREAFLIASHASYHISEIIIIRRQLGDWNK